MIITESELEKIIHEELKGYLCETKSSGSTIVQYLLDLITGTKRTPDPRPTRAADVPSHYHDVEAAQKLAKKIAENRKKVLSMVRDGGRVVSGSRQQILGRIDDAIARSAGAPHLHGETKVLETFKEALLREEIFLQVIKLGVIVEKASVWRQILGVGVALALANRASSGLVYIGIEAGRMWVWGPTEEELEVLDEAVTVEETFASRMFPPPEAEAEAGSEAVPTVDTDPPLSNVGL